MYILTFFIGVMEITILLHRKDAVQDLTLSGGLSEYLKKIDTTHKRGYIRY